MFRANPQRTDVYHTTGVRQFRGVKWKFQKDSSPTFVPSPVGDSSSPLVIADGVVYMGSQDGYLYAVDAQSGQGLWTLPLEAGALFNLIFNNGIVYIGDSEGRIYGIDIQTRRQQWKAKIGTSKNSAPLIVNGILYVGNADGNLYSVEAETGQLLWTFKTTRNMKTTPPAVHNGVIYLGSKDGNLYAVDAQTGQQKWKYEIGPLGWYSLPVVFDDAVYVEADRGVLCTANAETGQEIWRLKVEETYSTPICPPAITNGVAYTVALAGSLYAIDIQTRRKLWQKFQGAQLLSNLVVADGIIYCWGLGAIYALDLQSGEELWKFIAPAPELWIFQPNFWWLQLMNSAKQMVTGTPFTPFSTPVIADGVIYVSCGNGYLYALH